MAHSAHPPSLISADSCPHCGQHVAYDVGWSGQLLSCPYCHGQFEMPDKFDPYYKWLGIPAEEQPPDHYRLLGIRLFEFDPEVIQNACDQRMAHLKTFATGQHSALSQKLLEQVSLARVCLMDAEKKQAYDQQLQATLAPTRVSREPGSVLSCPHCAQPVACDDGLSGQLVACPRCTRQFTMPDAPRPNTPPIAARPAPPAWPWRAEPPKPGGEACALAAPGIHEQCGPLIVTDPLSISSRLKKTARFRKRTPHAAALAAQVVLGGIAGLGIGCLILWAVHPYLVQRTYERMFRDGDVPKLEPNGEPGSSDFRNKPQRPRAATGLRRTSLGERGSRSSVSGHSDENAARTTRQLNTALTAALRALRERKLDLAAAELEKAEELAKRREDRNRVESLKLLYHYLLGFWEAVKRGLDSLDAADEITINHQPVAIVVEVTEKQIILRRHGKNVRYDVISNPGYAAITGMPCDMVIAIAERWFDETRPENNIVKGAFLAVDAGAKIDDARPVFGSPKQLVTQ